MQPANKEPRHKVLPPKSRVSKKFTKFTKGCSSVATVEAKSEMHCSLSMWLLLLLFMQPRKGQQIIFSWISVLCTWTYSVKSGHIFRFSYISVFLIVMCDSVRNVRLDQKLHGRCSIYQSSFIANRVIAPKVTKTTPTLCHETN